MSWLPILNLGSSIKSGKSISNGTSGTVTFNNAFPDANYIVILTPYVTNPSNGPVQAWVSGSLTADSFTFNTVGADGVYWTATYSNS